MVAGEVACGFCEQLKDPQTLFEINSPIDEPGDVVLKPDLGMMMPGHLLAVTAEHHTSFAQLGYNRLKTVDARLSLSKKL